MNFQQFDILPFHLITKLLKFEVLLILSETCKRFNTLIKKRYPQYFICCKCENLESAINNKHFVCIDKFYTLILEEKYDINKKDKYYSIKLTFKYCHEDYIFDRFMSNYDCWKCVECDRIHYPFCILKSRCHPKVKICWYCGKYF